MRVRIEDDKPVDVDDYVVQQLDAAVDYYAGGALEAATAKAEAAGKMLGRLISVPMENGHIDVLDLKTITGEYRDIKLVKVQP